jgi:hypothetical protein
MRRALCRLVGAVGTRKGVAAMNPEVSLTRVLVIAAVVLLLAFLAAAVFTGVFDFLLSDLVNLVT